MKTDIKQITSKHDSKILILKYIYIISFVRLNKFCQDCLIILLKLKKNCIIWLLFILISNRISETLSIIFLFSHYFGLGFKYIEQLDKFYLMKNLKKMNVDLMIDILS